MAIPVVRNQDCEVNPPIRMNGMILRAGAVMTIFDQSEIDALLATAGASGAESLDNDVNAGSGMSNPKAPLPDELKRIFEIKVPVIVRLSQRDMTMEEILSLTPGSIIEFDTMCDEDLTLVVGNQSIGAGQAVKVGEKFGIRITRLADMSKRILAMGGDA